MPHLALHLRGAGRSPGGRQLSEGGRDLRTVAQETQEQEISVALIKLTNNILSAVALAATAEAFVMGAKGGLDPEAMVKAVSAGSGRNSAVQSKFPEAVLTRSFNDVATLLFGPPSPASMIAVLITSAERFSPLGHGEACSGS